MEIPRPDLQKRFTALTGERISIAVVQHLMSFVRAGKTDDEAILATVAIFNASPVKQAHINFIRCRTRKRQ